jgi:hypothetical protein
VEGLSGHPVIKAAESKTGAARSNPQHGGIKYREGEASRHDHIAGLPNSDHVANLRGLIPMSVAVEDSGWPAMAERHYRNRLASRTGDL